MFTLAHCVVSSLLSIQMLIGGCTYYHLYLTLPDGCQCRYWTPEITWQLSALTLNSWVLKLPADCQFSHRTPEITWWPLELILYTWTHPVSFSGLIEYLTDCNQYSELDYKSHHLSVEWFGSMSWLTTERYLDITSSQNILKILNRYPFYLLKLNNVIYIFFFFFLDQAFSNLHQI